MVSQESVENLEARVENVEARVENLSASVAVNRDDIDALLAGGARADRRADAGEALAADDRRRIHELEVRADVDREVLAELQMEGLIAKEEAAHLKEALRSSRMIGAALGIVMADRRVNQEVAFEVLRKASSLSNRKLRAVAEDLVLTGDASGLPPV
ncbi:ANTAR domain-containing protein [Terrabacter sp. BE26]|uniref:ANTAR domain-containing protein n=1 Tax=Terrabacter sp. BE26 TaxID=2898152 RepID=UPI0035BE9888